MYDTGMKTSTLLGILLILIVLAAGVYQLMYSREPGGNTTASNPATTNVVSYFCQEGKLSASFSKDAVALTYPDGTVMNMPHAMSADGGRYEATSTAGADVVFWSKGDSAFVTENGKNTYTGCVAGSVAQTTGGNTFTDQSKTFSIAYPVVAVLSGGEGDYTQSWMQSATTSGLLLAKLLIPRAFEPNTNFLDAQLTVGASADPSAVAACAKSPSNENVKQEEASINGVKFSKVRYSDAGAGNIYDVTSYRTVRSDQCYAVEFVVHTTHVENYPKSAGITAYDDAKIRGVLDTAVQSFTFLQ